MSLLNGYPLRKILKREVLLLILCSPLVLEVAMGAVFAIMIIIMNADELVGLTDQQVSAVLSYVRKAFADKAGPITAAEVKAVRASTAGRRKPWTAEELR